MKKWLIVVLIVLAGITGISVSILRHVKIKCELCLDFKGSKQCSEAVGKDQNTALEAARQNACALLASGVTEVLACQRTPALSTHCAQP